MEDLKKYLIEGVVTVNFTKVDGSPREMRCTTNVDLIPAENIVTESSRKKNEDVAVVWDLDKSAWRSFRFDSVNSYEPDSKFQSEQTQFFKGRAM